MEEERGENGRNIVRSAAKSALLVLDRLTVMIERRYVSSVEPNTVEVKQ